MESKTITIIMVTLAVIFFIGGAKIVYPFGMGTVIFLTFMVLYGCLPIWLRRIFARIHLIIDICITYLAYKLIASHTATGLFASAIVGLCVTVYLLSERKRLLGKDESFNAIVARSMVVDQKVLRGQNHGQLRG